MSEIGSVMEKYRFETMQDAPDEGEKYDKFEPQKLWFVDKNSGEKVVVAAVATVDGKISFSYQGKKYAFPPSLLGKRIHTLTPEMQEKPSVKEVFYLGEYFRLENDRWTSSTGCVPKEKYQKRLSALYQKRCKDYRCPVKELAAFAREQRRDADGIDAAISALEIAMLQATAGDAKGFLAILCSLYRQAGFSGAAVSLFDYAVGKYGSQIETSPFLTSVSAAYMDIGNISMADKVKKKAFALGGSDDAKLTAFAHRYNAETRLE